MEKPKVGVFGFTSCSGCQMQILDLEEELLDILKLIDFVHFPMAQEDNKEGPYDVAFVEGSIVNKEQEKELKKIREKAKYLIAFGTCATHGGIQSMKDLIDMKKAELDVYDLEMHTRKVFGIENFVKVDYHLRGCPPTKEEIVNVIKDLVKGKKPIQYQSPVCVECRKKGNVCLLTKKKPCVGPITYGGCDALCPSDGIACYGCRGPMDGANVNAEAHLFEKFGLSKEEIKNTFQKFAGTSKVLKKWQK